MKDILHELVTVIVEKPDEVKITEEEVDGVINFTISVNQEDMGRIIGKNGKVIRALRNVMKIPAIKQNKRIYINLANEVKE